MAQTSQSDRVVTLVAVNQGVVQIANIGGSLWAPAFNQTGTTLSTTGVVRSAANNQKLWFADGTTWAYYDPSKNSVLSWTASAGSLPGSNLSPVSYPRLICTWRGRTVVSGLIGDPQNWFMSAVGDPTSWNTAPFPYVSTAAVFGNNSPLGLIGDVVTSLVPWSDDVLIFGGDHTLYMLQGDPLAGGQLNLLSNTIGMCFGLPWCTGPDLTLYFVSNKLGVYMMAPGAGSLPQRMSQPIEQLLASVNTGSNLVRLAWDDQYQGFHLYVSPTAAAAASTHLFWEQRSGAWWTDVFPNNYNPLCCVTVDGNLPADRHTLIGAWDGYVRAQDPTALTDDGTAISSSVILGPLLTKDFDDMLLKDLQALLGEESGDVSYAVYVGRTAEQALSTEPVATGTWGPGRSFDTPIRRSGHAVYVELTATNYWAMEAIRARVAGQNKIRRRGY